MANYIETGYVEAGYFEAVSTFKQGKVPLKFFISSGAVLEAEFLNTVQGSITEADIALVYMPQAGKFLLGNTLGGFMEFVGKTLDTNTLLNDTSFKDTLFNEFKQTLPERSVAIKGNDGSLIAGAIANRLNEDTFEITVPDELVGTNYKIVLSGVF